METKLGLGSQADAARAPSPHQAVCETLVTSVDKSSELVHSGDSLSLCTLAVCEKKGKEGPRAEGLQVSGAGAVQEIPSTAGAALGRCIKAGVRTVYRRLVHAIQK